MKQIKITVAVVALLITAGFTVSSSATSKTTAPNDCAVSLPGSGTLDHTKCQNDTPASCCYLVASPNTQYFGNYIP